MEIIKYLTFQKNYVNLDKICIDLLYMYLFYNFHYQICQNFINFKISILNILIFINFKFQVLNIKKFNKFHKKPVSYVSIFQYQY